MGIISTLQEFKNKVKILKESQARANGGRKTPIYINMDSFALNLGWVWNGTTRTLNDTTGKDMEEFFTNYVPILNDLDIKIYAYMGISTIDSLGKAAPDTGELTLIHNRFPSQTTHTFNGKTFNYNFREITQANAELPWLEAAVFDHFTSYSLLNRSTTALQDKLNERPYTSTAGSSWSRFMHEIARQKMAGYHTDPNYNFSAGLVSAMSTYTYPPTSGNSTVVTNALTSVTIEDCRQIVAIFWRDITKYLKGETIKGSDGVNINITSNGSVPFKKVIHYANGAGPISNSVTLPQNQSRGIKPLITDNINYRDFSNHAVYYNKPYFRSPTTSTAPPIAYQPTYTNNNSAFWNMSYINDQFGEPLATFRMFPNTVTNMAADRTIYGYYLSPASVGKVKTFIACQSNADSYGTNLYFFHGCGEEYRDLIEAGIRYSEVSTSTPLRKYVTTSTTTNTSLSTFGTDIEITTDKNDVSGCAGSLQTSGSIEKYEDQMYWISSTLASHCGHLRKQITRNLEYNKAFLTGIRDSESQSQSQEIEKLAKKPICVVLMSTPHDSEAFTIYSRVHTFKMWPKNVADYVTPAITSFFKLGDKNTTLVERPDEIMFWNSSFYYDITTTRQTYGTTFQTSTGEALSNGIRKQSILGARIGLEKLLLGRPKITPDEECAINHSKSGELLNSNASNLASLKWCFDNALPDSLWTVAAAPNEAIWWTSNTSIHPNKTHPTILNKGLKALDDTDHELYPYLKGLVAGSTTDYYASGTIKISDIYQAIKRYQTNWVVRMLQETRKQLDALGA